jgi:hypothetical protein
MLKYGSMTREDLFNLHQSISQEALELMRKKNNDYACGEDPFLNFRRAEYLGFSTAELGVLIRMTDKMSRISTFLNRGELSIENESVYDAIVDMINYSVILAGLLKDRKKVV